MTRAFRSVFWLVCACLLGGSGTAVTVAPTGEAVRAITKPRPESVSRPGTYDPRLLMPLHVGNSWTYRWTSPKVPGKELVKFDKSLFESGKYYSFNGNAVTATRRHREAQAHEETYTIVRREGDRFFFDVKTTPTVSTEKIRDGRYEDSLDRSWTWWQEHGQIGLTEVITRPWGMYAEYLSGGMPVETGDFPTDRRVAIRLHYLEGRWRETDLQYVFTDQRVFHYRIKGNTEVSVPAGTFVGCAESIEKVLADGKETNTLLWAIHTFRYPGVGVVREYLKLPDGSIAYDLQLVSYAVAPGKAVADDGGRSSQLQKVAIATSLPNVSAEDRRTCEPYPPALCWALHVPPATRHLYPTPEFQELWSGYSSGSSERRRLLEAYTHTQCSEGASDQKGHRRLIESS